MKVKASITLSETMVRAIDQLIGKRGNRSAFIEQAVREHVLRRQRAERDARDIKIINANLPDEEFLADMAYLREMAFKSWDKYDRAQKRSSRKKRP